MNVEVYSYSLFTTVLGMLVVFLSLSMLSVMMVALKGIGRASYCVTGPWEHPEVERLSAEQLESGELCAALPPGGMPAAAASAPAPTEASGP